MNNPVSEWFLMDKAFDNKDYFECIKHANRVIESGGVYNINDAIIKRAESLNRIGKYKDVIESLEEIEEKPEYLILAYLLKGEAYYEMKKYQKSIDNFHGYFALNLAYGFIEAPYKKIELGETLWSICIRKASRGIYECYGIERVKKYFEEQYKIHDEPMYYKQLSWFMEEEGLMKSCKYYDEKYERLNKKYEKK